MHGLVFLPVLLPEYFRLLLGMVVFIIEGRMAWKIR